MNVTADYLLGISASKMNYAQEEPGDKEDWGAGE